MINTFYRYAFSFLFAAILLAYPASNISVFAAVAPIPDFCDTGGYFAADLSSAVSNKAAKFEMVVAVAVKRVEKSGREINRGVWYFKHTLDRGCFIKTDTDKDYVTYNIPGARHFCEDLIYFASVNAGGEKDRWPDSYLNGDLNYPLITVGGGGEHYLDLSSINFLIKDPPLYRITGKVLFVNHGLYGTNSEYNIDYEYEYDYEHFAWSRNSNGTSHQVHETDNSGAAVRERKMANALFRSVYGRPFFHNSWE